MSDAQNLSLCSFKSSLMMSGKFLTNQCGKRRQITLALKFRRSRLHCKDAAPKTKKKTSDDGEDFLCQLTHNSGPLHRVIRAGAARRSINASLMPRRTNCKPTIQHDERGRGGVGGVRKTGGRRRERRQEEAKTEGDGIEVRERGREGNSDRIKPRERSHSSKGRLKEGSLIKLKRRRGQVTDEHAQTMISLCTGNVRQKKEVTETDEAMEASKRGLELHVRCVNSGYADAPPHSHCERCHGGSQDLKAISWNKTSNQKQF